MWALEKAANPQEVWNEETESCSENFHLLEEFWNYSKMWYEQLVLSCASLFLGLCNQISTFWLSMVLHGPQTDIAVSKIYA